MPASWLNRHPAIAAISSDRRDDGRVGTRRRKPLHSPTPDTITPIACARRVPDPDRVAVVDVDRFDLRVVQQPLQPAQPEQTVQHRPTCSSDTGSNPGWPA
jgi:hypothetical protein